MQETMNGSGHAIMDYAKSHGPFTKREIAEYLSRKESMTEPSLSWYLSALTQQQLLTRVGRGVYALTEKNIFSPTPSQKVVALYDTLRKQLPFAHFCLYEGSVIAPLMHHLSPNHVTYVETEREATEIVFNLLKEDGKTVYISPTKDYIYHYVDMEAEAYFVKPMVTESPLQTIDGIPSLTIEKLLVDIRKDADFFFLQGEESDYILENAYSLYHINESRLLRYASRRGIKEEIQSEINKLKGIRYHPRSLLLLGEDK